MADCRLNASKVQVIVDDYKGANTEIGEQCVKISQLLLIKIDSKRVYEQLDFDSHQVCIFLWFAKFQLFDDHLGCVMTRVIDSSWEGQSQVKPKDIKIGICCFSTKHAALSSKNKDWSAQGNVACLLVDCCFVQ